MKKLNYVSGKCPKLLTKYLAATREEVKENQKQVRQYLNLENKDRKTKYKQPFKFTTLRLMHQPGMHRFEIQYLTTKVKEIVNVDFYNSEERFKEFRSFIMLRLMQKDGDYEVPASNSFKEQLMQHWLDVNGHIFEPTNVKALMKSSGASRNSKYKMSSKNEVVKNTQTPNEVIDLTVSKYTKSMKRHTKRMARKQVVKDLKLKLLGKNDSNNDDSNNNNDKTTINPDTFISMKNLILKKRSKEEFKTIRNKIKYQNNKEFDNCVLYAFRTISDQFPLDIFIDVFRGMSIDSQIELGSKILKEACGKEFKKVCVWTGTLNSLRINIGGKLLAVFLVGDSFHVEGIDEGKFGKDIQENILKMADEETSIDVYRLC